MSYTVFIAHSSSDKPLARAIAKKLQAKGHRVFFDEDSLRGGQEYDGMIRSAISECDVFVFLVSSASVRAGCYALTELKYAERRWPDPDGRVLPAIAKEIDEAAIPAYLLATVALYRPRGNAATEIAHRTHEMWVQLRGVRRARLLASAALALTLCGSVAAVATSHDVVVARYGVAPSNDSGGAALSDGDTLSAIPLSSASVVPAAALKVVPTQQASAPRPLWQSAAPSATALLIVPPPPPPHSATVSLYVGALRGEHITISGAVSRSSRVGSGTGALFDGLPPGRYTITCQSYTSTPRSVAIELSLEKMKHNAECPVN